MECLSMLPVCSTCPGWNQRRPHTVSEVVFTRDELANSSMCPGWNQRRPHTVSEVVFTRDEPANSSLTGKKSNAFQLLAVKEQRDNNWVKAVVGTLSLQNFRPHLYAVLLLTRHALIWHAIWPINSTCQVLAICLMFIPLLFNIVVNFILHQCHHWAPGPYY